MYAGEVPAYGTLVEVSQEVNAEVAQSHADAAVRLGSIERVTAERHGAIRVGTPIELEQVGRIFGAMGMHPVGFYDLRDAGRTPVPVVSTAFRPIESSELAVNPFRVFTSVLVTDDRRFFDAALQGQLDEFLAARTLFPDELLGLADQAIAAEGLPAEQAERFLELATASFALSSAPVDAAWYETLERISSVAADIGGVSSTHINHLTPRVLDIDALYERMSARGIEMIDEIQGPPRWDGPDVLLRQTSFRALAEPRAMRREDGSVAAGSLRVRFGEVEARGIALTPAGRDLVEELNAEVDRLRAAEPGQRRQELASRLWEQRFPNTEDALRERGLGYFCYELADDRPDGPVPAELSELVAGGWVRAVPVVYEDFLPRSAAGIFRSNLTSDGDSDASRAGSVRDLEWLAGVLGREVHTPDDLYTAQVEDSVRSVRAALAAATSEVESGAVDHG